MGVGEEGLAAVGRPLDVAVELSRTPGQADILGIQEDLGAESAAHVGRDHAHLVLGQAHDEGRHQQPLDVRVLVGHVQRVLVIGAAVAADGRARLHGVGNQAVVDQVQLGDVGSTGEHGIHGSLVADGPFVAVVVGGDVVHHRAGHAAGRRVGHQHHGGQRVVVHLHQLGRVARLLQRLGHDHGDLVAHVAHGVQRQDGMRRLLHGLAVGAGDQPAAGQAVDLVGRHVGAREHADDAGRGPGRVGGHGAHTRMRVRRAHEHRMGLGGQRDVVGVLARAREEAVVLLALDGLADVGELGKVGCTHGCLLVVTCGAQAAGPAMAWLPFFTAATMFW